MAFAQITIVERCRFPRSQGKADKGLVAQLPKLRKQARIILGDYRDAVGLGGKPLSTAIKRLSHSYAVRMTSAVNMNKRRSFARRHTLAELDCLSGSFNLGEPCTEPVRAFPLEKPNGDFRAILDFGPRQTIAQTALCRALSPLLKPRAYMYDDEGVAAAIMAVKNAMLSGHTAVAHTDVKNFYSTHDPDSVRAVVPLSGEMVENHMLARKLEIIPLGCPPDMVSALLSKARSGVPHGACSSAFIGGYTLSKLHWNPPSDIVLIVYVDNLLLLGKSLVAVKAAAKALGAACAALPTGHFALHTKFEGLAQEGFDFLGVNITMKHVPEITLLPATVYEFKDRFQQMTAAVLKCRLEKGPASVVRQALCELLEYVEGWFGAFAMCNGIASYRAEVMGQFAKTLIACGCLFSDLAYYRSSSKFAGYSD